VWIWPDDLVTKFLKPESAALVHVAEFPAHKSFVHFHRAESADLLIGSFSAGLFESVTDSLKHKPSGFLSDLEPSVNLPRGNAVLVVYEQPDGGKPFVERDSGVLEDGAHFGRELLAAVEALPDAAATQEGMPLTLAVWALNTVWPAYLGHELDTHGRVLEVASSFKKAFREWFRVFHSKVNVT
jgi:hypothetical protein